MFIVLRVWTCPSHVRGYLRRFFSEPVGNLFCGACTPRVAFSLWERVVKEEEQVRALLIYTDEESEQGFSVLENNLEALTPPFHLEKIDDLLLFGADIQR